MKPHVLFARQKVVVALAVFIQKVIVLMLVCKDMCMRVSIMRVPYGMRVQVRVLN